MRISYFVPLFRFQHFTTQDAKNPYMYVRRSILSYAVSSVRNKYSKLRFLRKRQNLDLTGVSVTSVL